MGALGVRRICPKCHKPFYDLEKHPVECPACQHSYDPDAPPPVRRKRGPKIKPEDEIPVEKKEKPSAKKEDDKDDLEEISSGVTDIEDISELESDDDVDVVGKKKTGVEEDADESIDDDEHTSTLIDRVEEESDDDDDDDDDD